MQSVVLPSGSGLVVVLEHISVMLQDNWIVVMSSEKRAALLSVYLQYEALLSKLPDCLSCPLHSKLNWDRTRSQDDKTEKLAVKYDEPHKCNNAQIPFNQFKSLIIGVEWCECGCFKRFDVMSHVSLLWNSLISFVYFYSGDIFVRSSCPLMEWIRRAVATVTSWWDGC